MTKSNAEADIRQREEAMLDAAAAMIKSREANAERVAAALVRERVREATEAAHREGDAAGRAVRAMTAALNRLAASFDQLSSSLLKAKPPAVHVAAPETPPAEKRKVKISHSDGTETVMEEV